MQVYNIYTVQWPNKAATDTEDPTNSLLILEDMPSHYIEKGKKYTVYIYCMFASMPNSSLLFLMYYCVSATN